MCEQFVARATEPFRIDELWPFTEQLERYGIAAFGWGAAWLAIDGEIHSHRDVRAFRDDPEREAIGRRETTSLLVHLRRPSRLSTIGLADTQPFDDPKGRYALSHNGDFEHHAERRAGYRDQGRIQGRADTEVGARWLEDAWSGDSSAPGLLESLHDTFGGLANLAVLSQSGEVWHYAGNRDNPVFTFQLGGIAIASTALYSLDRSLFRFVAPDATERRLVPLRTTASLAAPGLAEAVVTSR
jgi:glutamine phosphoribosylpyrophosphate amidotransferase